MSERAQSWIESTATSSGLRSLSKAFVISLCVHVALVGVLWQTFMNHRDNAQRDLRVDLVPSIRPSSNVATAPAPAEAKPEAPTQKTKTRGERALRAVASAQPAEISPGLAQAHAHAAEPVAEMSVSVETEAQQPTQGAAPIDLRVLDWLAQYRSYPLAARRARIEGVVQLRVTLLPDGRLVDARVERSSGHPLLDQAALDLLAHAAPLPSDFGSVRTAQIELQLPIVYRMRT